MRPPWSMVIFTTLAGAAQGLLLVLVGLDAATRLELLAPPPAAFWITGPVMVLVGATAGLVASIFHLGRPLRAWRATSQWRTSWLSREVIVLPAFMVAVLVWGLAHRAGAPAAPTALAGAVAALLAVALFVCTGMIYVAVSVIREWASPLTLVNFALLGLASGTTLATALAAVAAPAWVPGLAAAAAATTTLGALTRGASAWRNATLRPKTTLQTAIGVRHPRIVQQSQGAMGGSFGTREFFHGASERTLTLLRWGVALGAFLLPVVVLALLSFAGLTGGEARRWSVAVLVALAALQYLGLLGERWLFFAEGQHPQNLYHQRDS
ncbi:MAG: DmsC/YnfH family molybdoenzyme membrane anchor subunit [Rubrivivax sp.]